MESAVPIEFRKVRRWFAGAVLGARRLLRRDTGLRSTGTGQLTLAVFGRPRFFPVVGLFVTARFLEGPRFPAGAEAEAGLLVAFSYTPLLTRLMRFVASQRFRAG